MTLTKQPPTNPVRFRIRSAAASVYLAPSWIDTAMPHCAPFRERQMALRRFTAANAVISLFNVPATVTSDASRLACYDFTDAVVHHVRSGRYGLPSNSTWQDQHNWRLYIVEMTSGTNHRCFRIGSHCDSHTHETRTARVNGEEVETCAKVHFTGCHSAPAWTPIGNVEYPH